MNGAIMLLSLNIQRLTVKVTKVHSLVSYALLSFFFSFQYLMDFKLHNCLPLFSLGELFEKKLFYTIWNFIQTMKYSYTHNNYNLSPEKAYTKISRIKKDLGTKPVSPSIKLWLWPGDDVNLSFFMCSVRDIILPNKRFCEDYREWHL